MTKAIVLYLFFLFRFFLKVSELFDKTRVCVMKDFFSISNLHRDGYQMIIVATNISVSLV